MQILAEGKYKPSVTTMCKFLLLATCFDFWKRHQQAIKHTHVEKFLKSIKNIQDENLFKYNLNLTSHIRRQ